MNERNNFILQIAFFKTSTIKHWLVVLFITCVPSNKDRDKPMFYIQNFEIHDLPNEVISFIHFMRLIGHREMAPRHSA